MSESIPAPASSDQPATKPPVVPREYVAPFILVTTLFALWGFANDLTNPMVKSFQQVFQLKAWEGNLVQLAFYGGYGTMAIPAALFIRKASFKAGIMVGLSLYALGALLFIPASLSQEYWLFLGCFYVITFGLAFLETSANPYILSMGPPETATQRLNLAQAFNPMGSLMGMVVAAMLVLPNLNVNEFRQEHIDAHPEYVTEELKPSEIEANVQQAMKELTTNDPERHAEMKTHDIGVIRVPYIAIALVVVGVLVAFVVTKMPDAGQDEPIRLVEVLSRLMTFRYLGGVVAQAVYVGAQIMCWTNIIEYGMTGLGMDAATAQWHNIGGMITFLLSRFVWTAILRIVQPGLLLGLLAIGGLLACFGTVYAPGYAGIYFLMLVSFFMAAMFPTIYGLALSGMTIDDAKLGSAGLIFAILGGALMPPLQGRIIDLGTVTISGMELDAVRAAFFLPAACFVVIAIYGFAIASTERK